MNEIAAALLKMSDDALEPSMKAIIREWSDPPKSIEILEVLDKCIFSSLCTDFVIHALQIMYDQALLAEGKTHLDNEPLATWRDI